MEALTSLTWTLILHRVRRRKNFQGPSRKLFMPVRKLFLQVIKQCKIFGGADFKVFVEFLWSFQKTLARKKQRLVFRLVFCNILKYSEQNPGV